MASLKVAAIIPVYNRPAVVIDGLNSIAAQSVPPAHLIVVDDGSTDDTAVQVEQWITRTRPTFKTKLIRQTNQGAAVARNRGVAEAGSPDLLAFLDSDDLWPKDFLLRMTEAFERQPCAVAATCDRINIDFATKKNDPHSYAHYVENKHNVSTLIFMDGPPTPSCSVFSAAAFNKIGGFDARWPTGQDYDMMLRLSLLGDWLYVPGLSATTRNHTEVVTRTGEPPLSRKYADRVYRRAQMLDRFIYECGGAAVVPEKLWRRRLAKLWFRAGRKLIELDRRAEAQDCFRRTVNLRPAHLLARWRLLAST